MLYSQVEAILVSILLAISNYAHWRYGNFHTPSGYHQLHDQGQLPQKEGQ